MSCDGEPVLALLRQQHPSRRQACLVFGIASKHYSGTKLFMVCIVANIQNETPRVWCLLPPNSTTIQNPLASLAMLVLLHFWQFEQQSPLIIEMYKASGTKSNRIETFSARGKLRRRNIAHCMPFCSLERHHLSPSR